MMEQYCDIKEAWWRDKRYQDNREDHLKVGENYTHQDRWMIVERVEETGRWGPHPYLPRHWVMWVTPACPIIFLQRWYAEETDVPDITVQSEAMNHEFCLETGYWFVNRISQHVSMSHYYGLRN